MITWNGQQLLTDINDSINAQGVALASRLQTKARANAPYASGYLQRSIDVLYDAPGKSIEIYVGAEYGLFQEFGTRYIPPHPFIRPALNSEEIYGYDVSMAFTNTFQTDTKLLAHGPTFQMHRSLTAKQKHHVRTRLKPVSEQYYNKGDSNVARARLNVKAVPRRKKF